MNHKHIALNLTREMVSNIMIRNDGDKLDMHEMRVRVATQAQQEEHSHLSEVQISVLEPSATAEQKMQDVQQGIRTNLQTNDTLPQVSKKALLAFRRHTLGLIISEDLS